MSLFPAYGQGAGSGPRGAHEAVTCWAEASEGDADAPAPSGDAERALLASSDSEPETAPAPAVRAEPELDYYVDRRFDGGNLRVSTIYYPGRPQYNSPEFHLALGLPRAASRRKRARRYWEVKGGGGGGDAGPQGEGEGERGAALRRALVDTPHDEDLWLHYIDYQEWVHGAEAALAAVEAATARAPGAAALRARRHALLRRTLPATDYVTRVRDELAREKEPSVTAELWCRLVRALARAPAAGVAGARAAAAAAVRQCRRTPGAYPDILYAYGCVLRAAGLWESLVALLELVLSAALPGAGEGVEGGGAPFPPPRDPSAEREREERLQHYEDKVVNSGLPSGAVWARVERARGAAHWRPARGADADADADPQRAPPLADVADLVLPCADPDAIFSLLVNVLRLAKVPLLPCAEYVQAAAGGGDGEWDCGEALLGVARAAARVPVRDPGEGRGRAACDLLRRALDPPHYFSDDTGYLGWTEALWAAALGAARALGRAPAAALLCWRLRWLRARLEALPEGAESGAEARRIVEAAQASLKRWGGGGGGDAVPFALFARVQRAAAARAAGRDGAAARTAALALRAALRDPDVPRHHLLYIARIVEEVSGDAHTVGAGAGAGGRALSAAGACALASAALRRPPPDAALVAPDGWLREAQEECERRCASIEAEMSEEECPEAGDGGGGARLQAALLPDRAEWAAARAALASPHRREQLLHRLLNCTAGRGRWARWRERQACALVLRARGGAAAAPALSRRYPRNALLALVSNDASPWSSRGPEACPTPLRAVCAAWPALLSFAAAAAAAAGGDGDGDAAATSRAADTLARRLRRGGGDGHEAALPWALRLEAEARAPHTRLEYVAHAAMDALPEQKWLVVRSAALGAAGGGGALPDVLLERGLRLHALPDELRALLRDHGTVGTEPRHDDD